MYSIHLKDLLFFAQHGIHEEERLIGTNFEVSVTIDFKSEAEIQSIHETINYVAVYKAIKDNMAIPEPLLETLAARIIHTIYLLDDRITTIYITINKLQPPINNFSGKVGVSFQKSFS